LKINLYARIAVIAAIFLAIGIHGYFEQKRVCGGTKNPALCQLSLQAGDSDIEARNSGNGIFN
jgi:hypothetical protein